MRYYLGFFLLFGLVQNTLGSTDEVASGLVTELHRLEKKLSILVHADALWVPKSGDKTSPRRIEIFNAQGTKLLQTIQLDHNVENIRPSGKNRVILFGKGGLPYFSAMKEIERRGDTFQIVRSKKFPPEEFFDDFEVVNGTFYFSNIGDRGIYQSRNFSSAARKLPLSIGYPWRLTSAGDAVWVISSGDVNVFGDERIFKIKNGVSKGITPQGRMNLWQAVYRPELNEMWVTESRGEKVLRISTKTDSIVQEITVGGMPEGITAFGNCALVVDREGRRLVILGNDGTVKDTWSIDRGDPRSSNPRTVSVNSWGRVFVRSAVPCITTECEEYSNGISYFEKTGSESLTAMCQ